MATPPAGSNWRTLPIPTLGGRQLWADVFLYAGWRIQRHWRSGVHRLLDPLDTRLANGSYEDCHAAFDELRARRGVRRGSTHLVLLLHGIFRSKEMFLQMRPALLAAGLEAEAVNYPSTRLSIEDHADQITTVLDRSEGVDRVSFVGHSMGGLVARVVLARRAAWQDRLVVHRLLTIGTPHRGAILNKDMRDGWAFKAIAGPAGQQLSAEAVAEIPLPQCRFACIAGGTGLERGFNPLIPGDNDMLVQVSSALLEGAEDVLVVRGIHTFLPLNAEVIEATARYLETGTFHGIPLIADR